MTMPLNAIILEKVLVLVLAPLLAMDGALSMSTLRFTPTRQRSIVSTGSCPVMFVDSEAACAIQCYLRDWCLTYVTGPCVLQGRNPCPCAVCQMEPEYNQGSVGATTVGKVNYGYTTKRTVDEQRCGGGIKWNFVSPICLMSLNSISSDLGLSPILALRVVGIEAVVGRQTYTARPVCPPTFTARGETKCSSNGGVWSDQGTLACFPTECYQELNDDYYYAGVLNVTKSGRACWPWRYNGPFTNNYLGASYMFDYYDILRAENYCRPFHGDPDKVWCYNGNYQSGVDTLRWEECDLPRCADIY